MIILPIGRQKGAGKKAECIIINKTMMDVLHRHAAAVAGKKIAYEMEAKFFFFSTCVKCI